ncbi:hypothetical protein OG806_36700 [Streptomyces sp. NBC_00882]|uniref:hypothetical protein n=1 Tax=Streptomyces TaxID=1883 RepID=UPI003868E45C|nr:hypothetical protein OG806_36700 [Streptomyces sp. NBC_00882]WSZ61442.1 hypothetical protein OH824_35250 [Streptomyces canus]
MPAPHRDELHSHRDHHCPRRTTARAEVGGNHRNTREIAALAERFRVGATRPEPPFRSGPLPVVRHYPGDKDLAADSATMAAEQPRHRIGVIVNSLRTASDLMRRLERAGLAHEPQLYSSTAPPAATTTWT